MFDIDSNLARATAGDEKSQHDCGVWYLNGESGTPDLELAKSWFLRAAENGFVPSQTAIGFLLLQTGGDLAESRHWLLQAAQQSDREAQYRLGECLAVGLGGESDKQEARVWFEMAAKQDHLEAQCQLAYCLDEGIGGGKDRAMATHWWFKAADCGSPRAAAAIGQRYETADTLPPDMLKSFLWYQQASRLGLACVSDDVHRVREKLCVAEESRIAEFEDQPLPQDEPGSSAGLQSRATGAEPLLWSPRIFRLHGIISNDECRHLICRAGPCLRASAVLSSESGEITTKQGRRSGDMVFGPRMIDVVIHNIQKRLSKQALLPLENQEPLTVLHYAPGDEYKPHVDYFDPQVPRLRDGLKFGGQRLVTIIIYLNDVASGGGTWFPKRNFEVAAKRGDAVMFFNSTPDGEPDHDSQHAGLPIAKGEKWAAVQWFRERDPYLSMKPVDTAE